MYNICGKFYAAIFKLLHIIIMYKSEKEIQAKIQEIASKLKQLRKDKGYTSYETFAFEHDLNRVQYWRVENGQNITLKTLLNILSIHNISIEDFFADGST